MVNLDINYSYYPNQITRAQEAELIDFLHPLKEKLLRTQFEDRIFADGRTPDYYRASQYQPYLNSFVKGLVRFPANMTNYYPANASCGYHRDSSRDLDNELGILSLNAPC